MAPCVHTFWRGIQIYYQIWKSLILKIDLPIGPGALWSAITGPKFVFPFFQTHIYKREFQHKTHYHSSQLAPVNISGKECVEYIYTVQILMEENGHKHFIQLFASLTTALSSLLLTSSSSLSSSCRPQKKPSWFLLRSEWVEWAKQSGAWWSEVEQSGAWWSKRVSEQSAAEPMSEPMMILSLSCDWKGFEICSG